MKTGGIDELHFVDRNKRTGLLAMLVFLKIEWY